MGHDTTARPILITPTIYDIQRFWSKVKFGDGCWEWQDYTGGTTNKYGVIRIDNHKIKAHRLSWFIHFGHIPESILVCHHCDNPRCVRPDHLFLGTVRDNSDDMVRKGRAASGARNTAYLYPERRPRGETHGNHKLTEDDIRYIRKHYFHAKKGQRNPTSRILSEMFGIPPSYVNLIGARKIWKHVED